MVQVFRSAHSSSGRQLHKGEDPVDPRFVFEMTWRDDPRRGEEWKRGKLRPRGRLSQAEFESAYECRFGYVSTGKIWDVVQPDRVLWRTLHEWRRNVPDGLSVDDISKAYIEPMHGVHSHAGHALRYLCPGASQILHQQRQAGQETAVDREMPTAPAAQISQVLGRRP